MLKPRYFERLRSERFLDPYLSANDGARIHWPWRMQPPAEASEAYVEACDYYVIDSEPQSPSVTNREALDAAAEMNADAALLVDYFPFEVYERVPGPLYDKHGNVKDEADLDAFEHLTEEFDSAYDASIYSIEMGLELAEHHPFDGDLWVPLQPDHVDSYYELGEPSHVAIGGLKSEPAPAKVEAARKVREAAGPEAHVHGLGFGVTDFLAAAVREDPNLLDSIDYSTPVQKATNEPVEPGDERMSVVAAEAGTILIRDLRKLTPFPDEPERDVTVQSSLM